MIALRKQQFLVKPLFLFQANLFLPRMKWMHYWKLNQHIFTVNLILTLIQVSSIFESNKFPFFVFVLYITSARLHKIYLKNAIHNIHNIIIMLIYIIFLVNKQLHNICFICYIGHSCVPHTYQLLMTGLVH